MLDGNWIPSSFGTTTYYGVTRGLGVKKLTSTFAGKSRVVYKSLDQHTTRQAKCSCLNMHTLISRRKVSWANAQYMLIHLPTFSSKTSVKRQRLQHNTVLVTVTCMQAI